MKQGKVRLERHHIAPPPTNLCTASKASIWCKQSKLKCGTDHIVQSQWLALSGTTKQCKDVGKSAIQAVNDISTGGVEAIKTTSTLRSEITTRKRQSTPKPGGRIRRPFNSRAQHWGCEITNEITHHIYRVQEWTTISKRQLSQALNIDGKRPPKHGAFMHKGRTSKYTVWYNRWPSCISSAQKRRVLTALSGLRLYIGPLVQ